jgi:hypothetical protein
MIFTRHADPSNIGPKWSSCEYPGLVSPLSSRKNSGKTAEKQRKTAGGSPLFLGLGHSKAQVFRHSREAARCKFPGRTANSEKSQLPRFRSIRRRKPPGIAVMFNVFAGWVGHFRETHRDADGWVSLPSLGKNALLRHPCVVRDALQRSYPRAAHSADP